MDKAYEIMLKDLVCCSPMSNLDEPKILMEKYNCKKIPVVDKNHMIVGAVSEADLKKSGAITVIECMTKEMCAVEEDDTVGDCLKLMILNNIEQIAVIDKQGHYRGLVTERQLLKRRPD